MKKISFYLILASVIVIGSGCPKPCLDAAYTFAISSHITPDKDSVRVGDTIYLLSSTPTRMKDLGTGAEIDYIGAMIGSNLSVVEVVAGNTLPRDAVFDFDYISILGSVYNDRNIGAPDGIQQLTYEEINGMYELRIGMIARKKGLYALGIHNGISTRRGKRNICEKVGFAISLANTNQHIYLYLQLFPNYQFTDDGLKRVYYFKVY